MTRLQRLAASRWSLLPTFAAGALLPLAFEPVGWWWLALVCPAVLFMVGAAAPDRVAARAGYLFGIGFYGVGTSWIYISIGRYGDGGPVVGVLATALFIAGLALFPLLCVKLARRLRPQADFVSLVLAFPLVWLLLEWLRTWLFTGFPWLLLGYSQTDGPLAPLAPVSGVLGISLVLTVLAGLLAWVALRASPRRLAAVLAVAAVTLGGSRLLDRAWTEPAGEPLSVALIQGNIAQDKKWTREYLRITLDRYRELTERHWGVDLVVWPEAAIPNWYHQVRDGYLRELGAEAESHGTDIVLGVPYFDRRETRAYNSIVSLSDPKNVYHKRHLVPFGEYLPLRDVFGSAFDLLGAPMSDFSRGSEAITLQAAGLPAGVSVCYEVAFGPLLADVLPQAALLINVSNDAWFGDSLAPHQHLQMARMRALETGRTMLRATNTGITAVIDHKGRIVAQAPQFEIATLTAEATPRSGATPYVRWLDYPVLGLLALGLIALGGQRYWQVRVARRPQAAETEAT